MYDTIIHSENGERKLIQHGTVNWLSNGEFWFFNKFTKFWGKTDYWTVLKNDSPLLGNINII